MSEHGSHAEEEDHGRVLTAFNLDGHLLGVAVNLPGKSWVVMRSEDNPLIATLIEDDNRLMLYAEGLTEAQARETLWTWLREDRGA